ncbi:DUF4279 domain-containing protein [Streptomyces cucumeris]|uniref:DUF4279 domain-containing protein n=1 Tax=Streptomyces cucumeris TaxID=2962890 RepID=UPI003D761BB5
MGPWASLSVALVITEGDLVPDSVSKRLRLDPSSFQDRGSVSDDGVGEGCWVLEYGDAGSRGPDQLLGAVCDLLTSRRVELTELRTQGFDARIEIAGAVETNSHLRVSTETLSRLADLGIPISFTVKSVPERDDCDWLPSAQGDPADGP